MAGSNGDFPGLSGAHSPPVAPIEPDPDRAAKIGSTRATIEAATLFSGVRSVMWPTSSRRRAGLARLSGGRSFGRPPDRRTILMAFSLKCHEYFIVYSMSVFGPLLTLMGISLNDRFAPPNWS